MTLEELAEAFGAHITFERNASGDTVGGGIWFSRMQTPAALVLPAEGLPLGRIAEGLPPGPIAKFLKDIVGQFVDLSGLPDIEKVEVLEDVYLTRFEIDIADPIATSDVFVDFGIKPGAGKGWHLGDGLGIGDALVLRDLTVAISRIGALKEIGLDIHGTMDLWKGGPFSAAYNTTDKSISAGYVGQPIEFKELLDNLSLDVPGFTGTANQLAVTGNLQSGDYQIDIGFSKLACAALPFELNSCEINIAHADGKTMTSVIADMTFMYVDITVTAQQMGDGYLFRGALGDTPLKVGEIVAELAKDAVGVSVPPALAGLTVTTLSVEIDTEFHTRRFELETKFTAGGKAFKANLTLSIDGKGVCEPTGILHVGASAFALMMHHQTKGGETGEVANPADILAAAYVPEGALSFNIKDELVAAITDDTDVLALVPALNIGLTGVVFAHVNAPARAAEEADLPVKSNVLAVGLNTGDGIDITKLPLLGDVAKAFGASGKLGASDVQIIIATAPVAGQDVDLLNSMLGAVSGAMQLAAAEVEGKKAGLAKGFNLSGKINLGIETLDVAAGGKPAPNAEAQPADPAPASATETPAETTLPTASPTEDAHWFSIQKKIGPLYLEKVGVAYSKGELWIIPAASMTVSGLTISLQGFAVSSPLNAFKPSFHLQGLGLDFANGPVEIGGAFMRVEPTKQEPHEAFFGTVVLKTEALSLTAMGAYSRVTTGIGADGRETSEPSMFIYLELDEPIGGPPYFFVTGLALGFGYNRALNVPAIDGLASFPLIQSVNGGGTSDDAVGATTATDDPAHSVAAIQGNLATKLGLLKDYIPMESGQQWLAAGVHFTSFEIVDAFALLTITFGHRFEAHLLGRAVYCYPPGTNKVGNPLTKIDILMDAAYLPEQGLFALTAKLAPGSYLFEPDCHLSGGLAFRSWFDGPHKDEFIFTLGGYHPKFQVPDFYPKVDRLEFNWKKGDNLVIKGGMYFAMSGHALMVGGFLDATWESGALKAWLKITADFLIAYKPFHYDARMSIDIGAQVTIHFFGTHHLSVHLGASLHIWGPSFSGTASFDIWIASFSVSFGAGSDAPPGLAWQEFRTSFLPKTSPLISASVVSGMVSDLVGYEMTNDFEVVPSQNKDSRHWLMTAKHLSIGLAFQVPVKSATVDGPTPDFAIKPMGLALGKIFSQPEVLIWHEGDPQAITYQHFTILARTQNVPAGLWGDAEVNDVHAKPSVRGLATGLTLTPKNPPQSDVTEPIERANLAFDTETMRGVFDWANTKPASGDWRPLGPAWASGAAEDAFDDTDTARQQRNAFLDCFFDAQASADFDGFVHASELMISAARAPGAAQ